jgi:DHA2 family multidrug resistance protein
MFSLLRNLGSSIGISALQSVLVRNTQIMHARLSEHILPYRQQGLYSPYDLSAQGLAALNARVTRQATLIAYNNDFKMLLVITLSVLPMLLALRAGRKPDPGDTPIVVE